MNKELGHYFKHFREYRKNRRAWLFKERRAQKADEVNWAKLVNHTDGFLTQLFVATFANKVCRTVRADISTAALSANNSFLAEIQKMDPETFVD